MAFQLSPGVNVSEVDLTTVVPSVSTTAGAIVGDFSWGPANKRILVDSEITLVDRFGKPDGNNYVSFFSAANFLAYGNNLRVVRTINTTDDVYANNATSVGVGILIENEDDYELNHPVGDFEGSIYTTYGPFYARYPGELGNNIEVTVCANTNGFAVWQSSGGVDMKDYFDSAPGTSAYATSVGGSNDELHIAVLDKTGKITGIAGTVLETFPFVSKASDAKLDDGTPNYYVTQVLNKSKWIYIASHLGADWGTSAVDKDFGTTTQNYVDVDPLSGGINPQTSDANYVNSWELFANSEDSDVSLLIGGNASEKGISVQNKIIQIAANRKDCLAFISPAFLYGVSNPSASNIITYKNSLTIAGGTAGSYAVMDSGWKYQLDKYNNVNRFIPLNADIAGLCVYTDSVRDPWWSPAGLNRGQIKNILKPSWNPTKSDRDELYSNRINPVVSFPGEGVVLYGDKTLQAKPSAFDRINVRRLFIVLEKAIAVAAKYSLFEFNDEFTRAQFVALVEPYLRDIKGRRGIYDYRVVCDTTNNTPQVIDANQFVGDIYIKPARSINFIQLNFVAVRTGVDFTEIVGKF